MSDQIPIVTAKLSVENITKHFPGVLALDAVSFDLIAGEVHALCGENGAGKSTLMNVLSGNQQPDAGHITLAGRQVEISNQQVAQKLGIGIVHQERSLVENLSVAENIFAGNQPVNWLGFIHHRQLYAQTEALLHRLGMEEIDPRSQLQQLSPGKQQMVEIAKALSREPDILILDEPTAAIGETDTGILFELIRSLTAKGVAVIYISHRMAEIFEIADRVSVLKDGRYQGTREVAQTDVEEIIRMMVGRDLAFGEYISHAGTETILAVTGFSGPRFSNISFCLQKGEILGLAGLLGAGRTELARAIFAVDKRDSGQLNLFGKEYDFKHPVEAMKAGIGYLPENRKQLGLFLQMSVSDNIVATDLHAAVHHNLLQTDRVEAIADSYIKKLAIKTPSADQQVVNLSGGNQQKVVLAKWLLRAPDVLIVDEPTHGVDVGAKSEIYSLLKDLTASGVSIVLISSELPELLQLSDRILVLCNGKLTAELQRDSFHEETIMHYASGTQNMFV